MWLIEAPADVVEGKLAYELLSALYREAFDEMFAEHKGEAGQSWFQRRVALFFGILRNGKKFRNFGYTSMPNNFLFNAVWSHSFGKELTV